MGSAKSRNKGIKISKGNYITFLDDDDTYLSNKVEKQFKGMIKNNSDYSFTNIILENINGKREVRKRAFMKNNKRKISVIHLLYHITATSTLMFNRSFLMEIKMFEEEDLGDEFYLMMKATLASPKYYHCDFELVIASVDPSTGLSSSNNKIKTEEKLFAF